MKTIPEINTEISSLEKEAAEMKSRADILALPEIDHWEAVEKEKDKLRKRISMLRDCILYLETNPRPEFVQQMQDETNHKINVYEKRLYDFRTTPTGGKVAKPREYYYKMIAPGEDKLLAESRKQTKILNYILS